MTTQKRSEEEQQPAETIGHSIQLDVEIARRGGHIKARIKEVSNAR